MNQKFQEIVALLQKLPGIGPRAATRMTMSLLERPQEDLDELGGAIADLKRNIRQCAECFNISENDLCAICRDGRRDAKTIMVVEKITDLESVERSGLYQGLYHVLGGAIDAVRGVGPGQLRVRELSSRIERFLQQLGGIEVILATNPTASGEMTAGYIIETFRALPGIRTTRLARGLASGTHLEHADEITLRHALESRK